MSRDGYGPIFIGGTGRSGTSVLARLLGQHSGYALISSELVFHSATRGGLPALLSDRVTVDDFVSKMKNVWWYRERPSNKHVRVRTKGLHRVMDAPAFEAALSRFAAEFEDDRRIAARRLVRAVADPVAKRRGKPNWVESTPYNAFSGHTLARLFPEMKLIHIVRDGRDVAVSVAGMFFGPDDVLKGLDWWARRLESANRGTRRLRPDQLLVVQLEDLIAHDRERTYGRVLDFLEIEDDPRMRRYFDQEMQRDKANIGRWRRDLTAEEETTVDRRYRAVLARLRDNNVTTVPSVST